MRAPGEILLVACYELGHQPLAVAWPAAFLERQGYRPATMDVSVEPFDPEKVARARVFAISVPMHTALRLGVALGERVRALNPGCHLCFYGLYASLNAPYLFAHGADSVIGGESEAPLVALIEALEHGLGGVAAQMHSLDRARAPGRERRRQRHQRRLELAADHRVAAVREQVLRVQRRVEPVEADVAARIDPADQRSHAHAQPERCVHGNGDRDQSGACRLLRVELLDGDVQRFGGESGALEEGQRRGHGQRLMPQLIARHEQDSHRLSPGAPWPR